MLSKFRARLVEHGLERAAFEALLQALKDEGLVGGGGKARTDSTHVISAMRDLNRLELAGESGRVGRCPRAIRSRPTAPLSCAFVG